MHKGHNEFSISIGPPHVPYIHREKSLCNCSPSFQNRCLYYNVCFSPMSWCPSSLQISVWIATIFSLCSIFCFTRVFSSVALCFTELLAHLGSVWRGRKMSDRQLLRTPHDNNQWMTAYTHSTILVNVIEFRHQLSVHARWIVTSKKNGWNTISELLNLHCLAY